VRAAGLLFASCAAPPASWPALPAAAAWNAWTVACLNRCMKVATDGAFSGANITCVPCTNQCKLGGIAAALTGSTGRQQSSAVVQSVNKQVCYPAFMLGSSLGTKPGSAGQCGTLRPQHPRPSSTSLL